MAQARKPASAPGLAHDGLLRRWVVLCNTPLDRSRERVMDSYNAIQNADYMVEHLTRMAKLQSWSKGNKYRVVEDVHVPSIDWTYKGRVRPRKE